MIDDILLQRQRERGGITNWGDLDGIIGYFCFLAL
jgi:hypothetical protein